MDETRVFNPLDLQLSRSFYHWENHSMGTCLVGRLIPGFTYNVLPGTDMVMDLHSLFKMSTPVYPTMDYLYADIAFYFVPYKLVMSRRYASPSVNDGAQSWAGFIGAQDALINMPIPSSGVNLPIVNDGTNGVGSLLQYLYGPDALNSASKKIFLNALPLLSYFAIWNDNYREPNVQTPVTWGYNYSASILRDSITFGSTPLICVADCETSVRSGFVAGNYQNALDTNNNRLGESLPLPTSVFHGYFGSLLPWPQRNLTGVALPVGGFAPLKVGTNLVALDGVPTFTDAYPVGATSSPNPTNMGANPTLGIAGITASNGVDLYSLSSTSKSNLGVDLSNATAVDVEMLRALITKQHWYEDIARSGNRLDELEYGTFGVRPKDSGLDRPMYLGGKRLQLNVEMVASTNGGTTATGAQGQTTSGTLGDLGAFSHTNDSDFYFHQAFDTWGAVQCVFTIRAHNLIASGLDRHWLKETRDDWFWPEFANLGNQSILKREIAFASTSINDLDNVLGYQEYAEEWREPRDLITGLLVPGKSLGFMTYAHRYEIANGTKVVTLPMVLDASKQWIDVDRTLAVSQAASGFQFIYQFTFDCKARIPVGKYSYPGVSRV